MQAEAQPHGNDTFALFSELRESVLAAGGQYIQTSAHVIVHIPGKDRLVATFDNRACVSSRDQRRPWGDALILSQGWGCLGVMATRQDWFRADDLFDALETIVAQEILPRYRSFSLYGNSMGGYGALTFSRLFPDPVVVTFNPQTTLDPSIVPFERRFEPGRRLGTWNARYLDGVEGAAQAGKVYVFYDPMVKDDRLHALRLDRSNGVMLPCPWLTHPFMSMLASMQLLRPVALSALAGEMTRSSFYQAFRQRRASDRYMYEVLTAAVARNHAGLARKALTRRMQQWPGRDAEMLWAVFNQGQKQ